TSTGFHAAGGASAEAVALMRLVVGDALGVKASGGVRDCATALKMIANGATRIGTSSGVAMAACLGRGPLPMRELLSSPQMSAEASSAQPQDGGWLYFFARDETRSLAVYPDDWSLMDWPGLERLCHRAQPPTHRDAYNPAALTRAMRF